MTTWPDFESLDAAFANLVQELFISHNHMMATLRRDGSPPGLAGPKSSSSAASSFSA